MIGTKELKIMKPSAILINTARSSVIRQDALSKALEAGTISAFATDVFEREPPKHMPYFDFDNVLVTPHVAGSTKESGERMGNIVVDNILAAKSGVEPPDLVSAQTLYTTAFDAAAVASADAL